MAELKNDVVRLITFPSGFTTSMLPNTLSLLLKQIVRRSKFAALSDRVIAPANGVLSLLYSITVLPLMASNCLSSAATLAVSVLGSVPS